MYPEHCQVPPNPRQALFHSVQILPVSQNHGLLLSDSEEILLGSGLVLYGFVQIHFDGRRVLFALR